MATLIVLAVHPPGPGAEGICGGFVLSSDSGDRLEVAFRRDWDQILDDDVAAAVLNEMETTFVDISRAYESTANFVNHVENTYSNMIRSVDGIKLYSDLPLNEHALLLRRALLGEALSPIN